MWTSNKIETYPKQFDFTSSEQGKPIYTAMKIGEYEFINLIESIEIDDEYNFQNIICDFCGTSGCASGNWLAIRKSNDFIFFVPDFEDMKDELLGGDFEPSNYFKTNGSLFLTKTEYEKIRTNISEFKDFSSIPKLNKKELIELFKWDIPQKMFGEFPEFKELDTKRILITSELSNDEVINLINHKLNELENGDSFELEILENNEPKITIYLDDLKTTEWNALYKENDKIGLLLGGKFKIKVI